MKSVRLPFACAAMVLLSLAMTSCGSAGKNAGLTTSSVTSVTAAVESATATTASTNTASTFEGHREDRDKDYDSDSDSYFDGDDYNSVNYPHSADMAAKQAVATLVRRYFTAAAAEDGATGCSLIYSLFAETIPETLGLPPTGTPSLHGTTCAVVMTKLFKQEHRKLAAESATLQVAAVRVNHMRGLALLHFKGIPPQSIQVHLERGVWKINETVAIEVS